MLDSIRRYARHLKRWLSHRPAAYPSYESVQASLLALEERTTDTAAQHPRANADSAPILLLALGWRTGSTLLQRILMTDESLLVWGEPLGRMAILSRLTEALSAASTDWPPPQYLVDRMEGPLTESWVATMYPPGPDLRDGLTSLLSTWLAAPAAARGFARWGLKEVRLGAAEACVLRWLFPHSKIVVLSRNPLDAYLSSKKMQLWRQWPDRPVFGARAFAAHWNQLALSWKSAASELSPIVVRYEDLVAGEFDFRELESKLGLKLREQLALENRVGSTRRKVGPRLPAYEARTIRREARQGMAEFQYE